MFNGSGQRKKQVQTKAHPARWSTDHWRAAKHKKDKCEACGSAVNLVAHHVDQDVKNNDPSNIETLCKPCHDFWHNCADRNQRAVAGRMPDLYPDKQ